MANLKIDIAAEFTGAKAFKKAQNSTDILGQQVKKLGGLMAATFSADAIINFSKSAIKAFAEDQKSAALLANTVKNLGLAFETPGIEKFINKLSLSAGIADDVLRPAFQSLLTTTGSVAKSQEILSQAVDISRGSNVDIATVVYDLTQAYLGNVKGLKKYSLGLTQAELSAASFTDIQKKLTTQFKGSSAAYLDTYAGKMELLTTAANEAKETIGKGLVDALTAISGNTSVSDLATSMQDFATSTSNVISGIGVLIDKIGTLNGALDNNILKTVLEMLIGGTKKQLHLDTLELLGKINEASKYVDNPNIMPGSLYAARARVEADKAARAAAEAKRKADADAKKRADALLKSQKATAAEIRKQAMLKKQSSLFDLQQIQIIAALKGQLSEEDAKRLRLQLAILTGNESEAAKLTQEIANSIDSTGKLAEYLAKLPDAKNPFAAWQGFLDDIEKQVARIAAFGSGGSGGTGTTGTKVPPTTPTTNTVTDWSKTVGLSTRGYTGSGSGAGGSIFDNYKIPTVKVVMNEKVVAEAVQNQNNSGNYTGFSRLGDFKTS